jgi:hypothetical protein
VSNKKVPVNIHGLAIKFLAWCDKRSKKYKEIENCFISIQNNLGLLEYIGGTR